MSSVPASRRLPHRPLQSAMLCLLSILAAVPAFAQGSSTLQRGIGAAARHTAPPAAPGTDAVRVAAPVSRPHAQVERAYRALRAGDLAAAEQAYGRALADEPGNADAFNGLAVLALHRGQIATALVQTRRAAEADPADMHAQGRLADLGGHGDPLRAESRLRSLLSIHPEQAALHFALGNIYAAAGRWREARNAYQLAARLTPDDPDYRHNLAVSLDHLRQPSAAAEYRKALAAAQHSPAAFDSAAVVARLTEIAP